MAFVHYCVLLDCEFLTFLVQSAYWHLAVGSKVILYMIICRCYSVVSLLFICGTLVFLWMEYTTWLDLLFLHTNCGTHFVNRVLQHVQKLHRVEQAHGTVPEGKRSHKKVSLWKLSCHQFKKVSLWKLSCQQFKKVSLWKSSCQQSFRHSRHKKVSLWKSSCQQSFRHSRHKKVSLWKLSCHQSFKHSRHSI